MASSIIDRVRKLLALAKGNTNAEESAAAAAKAAELIERHRISQAMLEEPSDLAREVFWVAARMPWWHVSLAQCLCEHLGVFLMISKKNDQGKTVLLTTGRQEDTEAARTLFAYVHVAFARAFKVWCDSYVPIGIPDKDLCPALRRDRREEIRNGFFMGAVDTVSVRLEEMRARVRTETVAAHGAAGGRALALIDGRLAEAIALADQIFPQRSSMGQKKLRIDKASYVSGAIAARRVDLGGRKLAGARE